MRKFLIGATAAAVTAIALVASTGAVHAFNPADYTGNGQPQFNVYNDVQGFGNEHDFLRIGGSNNSGQTMNNNYEACDGEATVSVYVHNGAPETFNGTNNDGTGVAKNTRVKVTVPATSAGSFGASISADNAATVTDPSGAKITCNGEEVQLEYVPGSAQLFSLDRGNVVLGNAGDAIVSASGLQLGSLKGDGIVPGCWNSRNYVKMNVRIKKIVKTPVYSCDLFTAIQSNDNKNKYTFKAKASATNAAIKSFDIDFGNGQKQTIPATGSATSQEVTSQAVTYTKDATAKVTVNFAAGNETKSVSGDKCSVQVKLNQPPVNPTPPVVTTVTRTPDTGAGSTIGMFASVTALAYGFKRYIDSRRANARG